MLFMIPTTKSPKASGLAADGSIGVIPAAIGSPLPSIAENA